jgi:ribosome-binding factor A
MNPRNETTHLPVQRCGRKTLQLCRQVERALNYVLAGECDDDVLRDLTIVSVEPAPDASRMMVTVAPSMPGTCDLPRILEHLQNASGMLRSFVAASIHRKRAPELAFRVALVA